MRQAETKDLGLFAAVLAPGQTSPLATEYKETKGAKSIPYDYTVEVRNRFKGLDLIDRVPDELWTEVCPLFRRQGSRPSPWKRNAKSKTAVWGGLTNSCEKKRSKKQRRKGKI